MQKSSFDIYCRVIDNYGDIGVCWRLSKSLASRGHVVRLIVDDASALAWMAKHVPAKKSRDNELGLAQTVTLLDCVEVVAWHHAHALGQPADVVIEAFGCELPECTVGRMALKANSGDVSRWINLEYLTAQSYAQRNHLLPSPVLSGVGKGLTKTFFYPGFTHGTGGLLREPDLQTRQAKFDKTSWLNTLDIAWHGERIISLFCYESPALPALLEELQNSALPTLLLVTAGRATAALQSALTRIPQRATHGATQAAQKSLRIQYLPHLTQDHYDHLLWASDFNFVRGEDSLVRAIWAGKPFVWHIYPQDDGAHHAKLAAFLDAYLAHVPHKFAAHIHAAHALWNGLNHLALPKYLGLGLPDWPAVSCSQSSRWVDLPDWVDGLLVDGVYREGAKFNQEDALKWKA